MTPADLVAQTASLGCSLALTWVETEARISWAGKLPVKLVDEIRAQKPELIAYLTIPDWLRCDSLAMAFISRGMTPDEAYVASERACIALEPMMVGELFDNCVITVTSRADEAWARQVLVPS